MIRPASLAALAFILGATSQAAPVGIRRDWVRGPDMPQAEAYAAAASVGGRFYVFGGQTAQKTQAYDPETGEWTLLAPPPVNVAMAKATAVGRIIYVYGGCVNSDCSFLSGANWAFDTATGIWTEKAPMPIPRQGMAAGVIAGRIYVAGGFTDRYVPSAALTIYDPVSDAWTTKASMPKVRANGGAAAVNGTLYYVGGTSNSWGRDVDPRAEVMAYDPDSDSWSKREPLPMPLVFPGVSAIGGKIYAAGGVWGQSTPSTSMTWIYDTVKNTWSPGPPMRQERSASIFAGNEEALFAAGGFPSTASFEYYDLFGAYPYHPYTIKAVVKTSDNPAKTPTAPPAAGSDVDHPSLRAALRPNDYALVIGIEKYSRVPDARFAENDADAMKTNLLALGYPERNIILLKGGRATRGAVQGYVEEWLPKNVHRDSRVFVYFSGHGSPDTKNGDAYLVPWDGDAMFLKSTAYPLETLYASLGRLKVKHVIVALDSCFSGAGGRSVLVAGARPLVSRFVQIDAPTGVTVLTAASGDEITGTMDDRGHGAFTYYLLKALDRPGPTVKAVYRELKPLVQDEAHRQNREQTPLMLGDDASF